MSLFTFTEFEQWIAKAGKQRPKAADIPVYLIYGDEYLCKKALKALLALLLPGNQQKFNYEPVDGLKESIASAVEKLNTYAFMGGRKAIGILDAQLTPASKSGASLAAKAKDAWVAKQKAGAARSFVRLLAASNLSWEDLDADAPLESLKNTGLTSADSEWVEALVDHCREKGIQIPEQKDDIQILLDAVKKGFPNDHFLMMTTDGVDKRRVFYKTIESQGLIIDCSVPKGERVADRKIQQAMLRERSKAILSEAGKTMDPAAFQALFDKTGFDLRGFSLNLEKLIQYCGERPKITPQDVAAVLVRTKKDPIYEMTQAVSDGNLAGTLFYMRSLSADGIHPLQMLAAIHNQVRKLLMAKAFVESKEGRAWTPSCTYDHFRYKVMPAVVEFDRQFVAKLEQWNDQLKETRAEEPKSKKKKAKPRQPKTDLPLVKNPNNAYPVFQTIKKADRYSMDDLLNFVMLITDTDRSLKTSGQNPILALEALAMKMCRPKNQAQGG
jgi:DNA polymerase III subunit delta